MSPRGTQILRRAVPAKVLARRGERESPEKLVREAVALADSTDLLDHRGAGHLALAEVLRLAGREGEASSETREIAAFVLEKGNIASAGWARALLAELQEGSATS